MSYASGSAISGALAQLLIVAPAALPAGSTVWWGAELPAYTAPLTLWVSEITGDQVPATMGNDYLREETFRFVCSLITYQGGVPDYAAMLQSLMTDFIALSRAIANNPTLNQTVRFAEVGNFDIKAETDTNGFGAVTLDFSIRCQQRVTSLS